MYSVISAFHQTIISEIDPQYVKQYEWIREKVAQADSESEDEKRKARYRETDDVKEYFGLT